MKKKLAIFGSTGSIGQNTTELVSNHLDLFSVEILTAFNNYDLLIKQAKILKPKYICLVDEKNAQIVKDSLKNDNIIIVFGFKELLELAKIKVDLCVMAISGIMALEPTINSIESGSNLAIANKESIVCAGKFITDLAQKKHIKIIPLDSEHSGLFQIFDFENPEKIKNITITASGGPFLNLSFDQLKQVTPAQAVKHPNWSMGAKISVDSASLVNKCLEVIEAYHLFPIDFVQIKILIHPQSIIHAIVNFINGSMHAQLSTANMKIPIAHALFYPQMISLNQFNNIDLAQIGKLEFYEPDDKKFKSLNILNNLSTALDTNLPIAFNVANDLAVDAFLRGRISFLNIYDVIEEVLNLTKKTPIDNIQQVFSEIDQITEVTKKYLTKITK